jgi:hypothetical protein
MKERRQMPAPEVYQPDQWNDFFVAVGGGAAALTGLVFVALSLNLDAATRDATHRYRAIGTLTGFVSAFVVCSLALMGHQGHIAVGVEWLTATAAAGGVYVYGYVQAIRLGQGDIGLGLPRLATGTAYYLGDTVGAAILIAGYRAGLYIAATSMIALLAWMITGAWLLIMGGPDRRQGAHEED